MTDTVLHLLVAIVPTVLAITLHEMAHGYAALALGDDTARNEGRLSPNPLRHVDRVGTIIVPGVLLLGQFLLPPHKVLFMFGWAKPVPVAAWRFRDPRRGMAVVALAGPMGNFALAWLAAVALHAFPGTDAATWWATQFLRYFILSNLVLGLFNLLPVPPMDGGRVAVGILPLPLAMAWARLERAGIFVVLFVVFLLPHLTGYDPVGKALDGVLPWAIRAVVALAGHG
jgi:Zn-dependent protease